MHVIGKTSVSRPCQSWKIWPIQDILSGERCRVDRRICRENAVSSCQKIASKVTLCFAPHGIVGLSPSNVMENVEGRPEGIWWPTDYSGVPGKSGWGCLVAGMEYILNNCILAACGISRTPHLTGHQSRYFQTKITGDKVVNNIC